MFNKRFLAIVASVSAAAAAANFDAGANTNMAVYWGQGAGQQRLAHFCADSSIDIIPIGFLNVFPDQVNGGYPGTNFGNQCGSETFKNKDGSDSPLLSNCPLIGPDIKTCQAMGKKLLLSLGGAIPTDQSINNDESAVAFAHFLWNAFGPEDASYNGPRPFGDAVIDGFDFDIESAVTGNDPTSQYRGYGTMINTLRILFATDAKNEYYISGSPQCVIPDAHLAEPIETSWFDFLFIQFYNTPQCSARAYFDASYGRVGDQPSSISFDAWVGFVRTRAMNKDVKLYIGLPAAPLPALVYEPYMYIAPEDVVNLIDVFQCRYPKEFGGIMVFEATYSEQNLIDNKPFVDVIKSQLTDNKCAKPATSTSSTMSSTATSLSSVSSISSTAVTSSPTSTTASIPGFQNSSYSAGPTAPIGTGSSSIPSYSSTGIWNGTSSSTAIIGTGPSSIPPYPTSTGISNVTSSSITIIGTGSSSIPPYPTSTGIWNGTSSSTSIIGTGSSSILPYPTSTGIWNGTSSSTSIISTGSSSIPPYPTSTGIWNGTSSSTSIISTGSSSIPPYPTSSGIGNATTSLVSSGTGYTSSSVPVNSSTSASSHVSTSSSVTTSSPVTTGSYSATTLSLHPTGGSSGFSSSISSTSVPYPVNNSTSTATTSASGGVIYTTETITVTKCPPHVTSCPVHTSVTVYPITSSSAISVISSSSNPIISSHDVPVTSVPTNSPQTTTTLATTPASGGVIYTTETITFTKCPPEVTNCPVGTSVTVYPITSSSSVPVISSSGIPVSSVPANSPETTTSAPSHGGATTLIVTTYVTTCPVTNTITTQGSTIIQTSFTVSTATSTITSIISSTATTTTKVPETTPATTEHVSIPVVPAPSPGHGGSSNPASPPSGSNNSPVGGPDVHPAGQSDQPANGGPASPAHSGPSNSGSSPGSSNSPIEGGNSPGSSNGGSSSPGSPPSSHSGNSQPQLQQPAHGSPSPGASTPPTGNTGNSSVNGASNQPPQGSPAGQGLSTVRDTSTKFHTSTIPASPANSGIGSSSGTASLPVIITQTLVPIPMNPEQTAHPAVSSSGPGSYTPVQPSPVPSSAPFPVNNGTATAGGPTGSSLSAPGASGTGAYSPGNVMPFTGGASKMMGSSVVALAVILVAALYM